MLGPLLFLIFIDDLSSTSIPSTFLLFADDSKCNQVVRDESDCSALQDSVNSALQWSK